LLKEGIDKISHHAIPSVVIMAGTKVLSGSGKMVVINVGPNSSIGKIKAILVSEDEMTPLQMKLEKIARDIGIFGLIAAIIIFVVLIIRLLIEGS
jgi:magnesium-transporting ATPase (P-type)